MCKQLSRSWLSFIFLGVLAGVLVAQQPEPRPNLIYIMADDLGYGDLGCYGQQTLLTPNIDRLAAEGIRLTEHYSGHTVCRPSRLVLLTGKHSGHTAISSNAGYTLPDGARTVTGLLKEAGYATGGVGKWALGTPGTSGVPSNQHFDMWFGYLDQGNAHNFYPEYLWKNDTKIPLPGNKVGDQKRVSIQRTVYSHDLMTSEALAFIRANASQPFLLQVHYTIPHANNEGGRATGDGMEVPDHGPFRDKDWPEPEKGFAAMMATLDRDVGRIITLLKELKLDERTLVIITSDNGPHQEGGHKVDFFDSNGPLRGFKRDLYEGGIRVPLIARWPGRIRPGTQSAHISAFWDFLPLACEVAGIEPPEDIDGISYLPALLGQPQKSHDYLYWQAGPKVAVRKGQWKAVRVGKDKPLELYDLTQDLSEQNNLAGSKSGIATQMQHIVDEIQGEQDAGTN